MEEKDLYSDGFAEANLDFWISAARFSKDEAVALSLGKEPKIVNKTSLEIYLDNFGNAPFIDEYRKITELIERAFYNSEDLSAKDFFDWCMKNRNLNLKFDFLEIFKDKSLYQGASSELVNYNNRFDMRDDRNNENKIGNENSLQNNIYITSPNNSRDSEEKDSVVKKMKEEIESLKKELSEESSNKKPVYDVKRILSDLEYIAKDKKKRSHRSDEGNALIIKTYIERIVSNEAFKDAKKEKEKLQKLARENGIEYTGEIKHIVKEYVHDFLLDFKVQIAKNLSKKMSNKGSNKQL